MCELLEHVCIVGVHTGVGEGLVLHAEKGLGMVEWLEILFQP